MGRLKLTVRCLVLLVLVLLIFLFGLPIYIRYRSSHISQLVLLLVFGVNSFCFEIVQLVCFFVEFMGPCCREFLLQLYSKGPLFGLTIYNLYNYFSLILRTPDNITFKSTFTE